MGPLTSSEGPLGGCRAAEDGENEDDLARIEYTVHSRLSQRARKDARARTVWAAVGSATA